MGLPGPVSSSSTCLGVNTQRFVDSCPHAGLSVLDNWILGVGLIRWVSLLLPAISESKSHIQLCRKFSVVVEVTQKPSGT